MSGATLMAFERVENFRDRESGARLVVDLLIVRELSEFNSKVQR